MASTTCYGDDCKSEAVKDQVLCGTLKAWQHFPRLQRRSARREGSRWRTRVTHQGGGMISVSDHQLRIVAAAADLLAAEARGTFLRCVVAELRGRGDFSDCDVEQVVRAGCSISQPHGVLEANAAGASGPDFPVERWRVKTAPRVRCPAPGLGMPLVGSGVLRLRSSSGSLAKFTANAAPRYGSADCGPPAIAANWRSHEGGSDDACFVRRSATGDRGFHQSHAAAGHERRENPCRNRPWP